MGTEQTTTPDPAPWTVHFRDGMWEVTCSDGSLGGRFPREGDARTFADVAGPGPMTIVSKARLDRLAAALDGDAAATPQPAGSVPVTGVERRNPSATAEQMRALAADAGAADEMEEHFIDANERMGEALVKIGMALGLPRPGVGANWGAPEILARIAEVVPAAATTPTGDVWTSVENIARELEILADPDIVHGKWIVAKLARDLRAVLARRTEEGETNGR
jgi:hypothetical protein